AERCRQCAADSLGATSRDESGFHVQHCGRQAVYRRAAHEHGQRRMGRIARYDRRQRCGADSDGHQCNWLLPDKTFAMMSGMFRPQDLLDLAQFQFPELFDGCDNVWDALPRIAKFVKEGKLVGKGTMIEEGATIKGPVIFGRDCEIRANAYIRGN